MGPGGLMGMVSQLAQSPAMQQMAEQLAGRMAAGGDQSAQSLGGRSPGARGEAATPDFGSFLQQMLPMVGQASCTIPVKNKCMCNLGVMLACVAYLISRNQNKSCMIPSCKAGRAQAFAVEGSSSQHLA